MSSSSTFAQAPFKVYAVTPPVRGETAHCVTRADFVDAYCIADPAPAEKVIDTWLRTIRQTPAWIEHLMGLRNRIVRWVGLKDLGLLRQGNASSGRAVKVGDTLGIFQVRYLSDTELILGQDDRHLDVHVSMCRCLQEQGPVLVLTTAVHLHNALGRTYLALIKPFHRKIVRTMLITSATLIKASKEKPPSGAAVDQ